MKMFLQLGLLATVLSVPLQLSPKHDSGSFVETMSSSRLGKDVCNQYEYTKSDDVATKQQLCAAPIYVGVASKPREAVAPPDKSASDTNNGQTGTKKQTEDQNKKNDDSIKSSAATAAAAEPVYDDIVECTYLEELLKNLEVTLVECAGQALTEVEGKRAGLINVLFEGKSKSDASNVEAIEKNFVGKEKKVTVSTLNGLLAEKQLTDIISKYFAIFSKDTDGKFMLELDTELQSTVGQSIDEKLRLIDDNVFKLAKTVILYNFLGVTPVERITVKSVKKDEGSVADDEKTCMDSKGIYLEFSKTEK